MGCTSSSSTPSTYIDSAPQRTVSFSTTHPTRGEEEKEKVRRSHPKISLDRLRGQSSPAMRTPPALTPMAHEADPSLMKTVRVGKYLIGRRLGAGVWTSPAARAQSDGRTASTWV